MTEHALALAACRVADRDYSLVTLYDEADTLSASGQILATAFADGGATSCVLNARHPLTAMCCSPQGVLWVVASDALVFTTADGVTHAAREADFDAAGSGVRWTAQRLPRLGSGEATIPTAIGGGSGTILIGTASGHLLRRTADGWQEDGRFLERPLNGFATAANGAVFAYGYDGVVLVRVGENWQRLPLAADERAQVTGMAELTDGSMAVCCLSGSVYRLTASGSALLGRMSSKLYGILSLGDRLVLAGDPVGAWKLRPGSAPTPLRDTFQALKLFRMGDELLFVLAEQPHGPGFA